MQALSLPDRDHLPDFVECRYLLRKAQDYVEALKDYLEGEEEDIGYADYDNEEHLKMWFSSLPREKKLPKELKKWFAAHCSNKDLWVFTEKEFNGHGMTRQSYTGWMESCGIDAYEYYYTDNASDDNAEDLKKQIKRQGLRDSNELEKMLRDFQNGEHGQEET